MSWKNILKIDDEEIKTLFHEISKIVYHHPEIKWVRPDETLPLKVSGEPNDFGVTLNGQTILFADTDDRFPQAVFLTLSLHDIYKEYSGWFTEQPTPLSHTKPFRDAKNKYEPKLKRKTFLIKEYHEILKEFKNRLLLISEIAQKTHDSSGGISEEYGM